MSSFTKKNSYSKQLYLIKMKQQNLIKIKQREKKKKNLIKKLMLNNLSIRIDKDYINDIIYSFTNLSNIYKFKDIYNKHIDSTNLNNINKFNNIISNSNEYNDINIIACICIHNRNDITKLTMDYLKTIDFYKIIICYSNIADYNNLKDFHSNNKFHFVCHNNRPLSLKWNKCVQSAQQFNPDAVMILGDDDIILDKYLTICKYYIKNGYDYLSNNKWSNMILNLGIISHNEYSKTRSDGIGAGRVISKNILNKYDYNIYNFNLNKNLDGNSFNIYKKSIKKKHHFNNYFVYCYSITNQRKGITINGSYLDFLFGNDRTWKTTNIYKIYK